MDIKRKRNGQNKPSIYYNSFKNWTKDKKIRPSQF